jgi:hypothetical protein
MATLELNELACERKQDAVGKDEPEIWIDGAQVWTGSMGKGDSAVFSPPIKRTFKGQIVVELKERDGSGGNANRKLLGQQTFSASSSASPATFSASGYRYKLHYRVV